MSAGEDDRRPEGLRRAAPAIERRIPIVDGRVHSRDLFAGARAIAIIHGDETYQLRITAQNKLLLTK
jgi:hemin uptake protein HemP